MEREKDGIKSGDESGFSEKKLDINIETGNSKHKKLKKTLFEKKRSKML